MKKTYYGIAILLLAVISLTFIINGCNKLYPDKAEQYKDNQNTTLEEQSNAVTAHILAFKEKDGVKCVSGSDMNFYEAYYIDYAQTFENETGKKFYQCVISGNPYYSPSPYHIQHDYHIFVGNRFLICTATSVEDITVY